MKIGIIGGGIIGLYAAWKLSENNENITLFEKNNFSKYVCSGLVTERIWDFVPKNKKIIENRINKIKIHFPKKTFTLILEPNLIVLNRKLLNKHVYHLAKKSHVKFVRKEIKSLKELKKFDFVVGAYGANSNFTRPKSRLGIYTYENRKIKSNIVDVYPLKNGFSWKIPRKNKIEYGVIENIDVAKSMFLKLNKKGKIYSALIPQDFNISNEIALVGDAAGLCKPHSGGGIIWGMESVNILLKTYPNLRKYNKELRKFFEPKILTSKLAAEIGMFFGYHLPFIIPKQIIFDNDWIF